MNKRGQFFILAAVIFSGLLLSVSLSVNQITTLRQNTNFYKSSEIIGREISNVQSYQISSNDFNTLEGFAENLSANLLDNNPNLNFVLIYGNSSLLKIRNFGSSTATVVGKSGESIPLVGENEEAKSNIKLDIGNIKLTNTDGLDRELELKNFGKKTLSLSYGSHEYLFNISSQNQLIYILQEESGGANYVEVK